MKKLITLVLALAMVLSLAACGGSKDGSTEGTKKSDYPKYAITVVTSKSGSAVDSFVVPVPSDMPGYESQVIMAAGAFTLGSSIELSADAPLREPYAVWMQGGLNFHGGKLGVMLAATKILRGE